jgi:hypothetical protein
MSRLENWHSGQPNAMDMEILRSPRPDGVLVLPPAESAMAGRASPGAVALEIAVAALDRAAAARVEWPLQRPRSVSPDLRATNLCHRVWGSVSGSLSPQPASERPSLVSFDIDHRRTPHVSARAKRQAAAVTRQTTPGAGYYTVCAGRGCAMRVKEVGARWANQSETRWGLPSDRGSVRAARGGGDVTAPNPCWGSAQSTQRASRRAAGGGGGDTAPSGPVERPVRRSTSPVVRPASPRAV